MSQFTYVLPSGARFDVNGPPGATQDQADRIFYEQVAAGSLVGYTSGQTLTSAASKLTKFELSRLERGSAGTETNAVLSIIDGLPLSSGITNPSILLQAVQNIPIPVSMPDLNDVPLLNPIDQADTVSINEGTIEPSAVGPLSSYQVQKLLAQVVNYVDQRYDQISQEKGIGQYGFTAYTLEQAGYVKPGTTERFFNSDNQNFVAVMSSPSVWTGKDGIYKLEDLLSSAATQTIIQNQVMQQSYEQLKIAGIIVEPTQTSISVSAGNVYTNNGLGNLGSLLATSLLANRGTALSGMSQNFLTPGTALNNLLGTGQINLSTIESGAVSSFSSGALGANFSALSANNTAANIQSALTGDIGSLVNTAGKFGTDAAALWAKSGINNLNLGSVTTGITGSFSSLASGPLSNSLANVNLNSITTNLTNVIPGSLSNLTGSMNVLGKASQFASGFQNPLTSLNNIGGALQGQATAALTNLQGQATAALTNLQGQATAALTNLQGRATAALGQAQALAGNLANLSLPVNLFEGGGDLVSGTKIAAGFTNTVNRKTLDAAVTRVLGSAKIPTPSFEYPSPEALSAKLDITQAQNFLKNIQGQGQALLGQGQALLGQGRALLGQGQAIASQAQTLGGRLLG
jgi:hypothetical protein